MKKPFVLACLVFALICVCVSCSSDDNSIPEPEESFYALRVGNSWVYKYYRRENILSSVFNDTGVIDSVTIVDTEMINGNEFYKFRIRTSGNETNAALCAPNGERFVNFRDSLGYLITDVGQVEFSREDDQEFLLNANEFLQLCTARGEGVETISTEAGSFDCEWMKVYAKEIPSLEVFPALDKNYYADGIGKILNTCSFASQDVHVMERRLVSYNVQ
ncbi:hypothetical protein [Kordia sp.]|uniref:hypothetical protein n=1 Tax=Kordia sp. TaxID=1965332 RepID=UPI003D27DFE2